MNSDMMFSKDHIWVNRTQEGIFMGLSLYACEKLGSIMFVNLPEVGEKLEAGVKMGDIESIKTVSDLISPIAGTVFEVNKEVVSEPEIISDDPYNNWFICVQTGDFPKNLMDEKAYKIYTESL